MYLSIIIPCYNEEKRVGTTLERICAYMEHATYEYEVIVVDNGYVDATQKVVESFKGRIKNLRMIHARSHGKGWAVKTGMLNASGDYRLFTDADNATDIFHLDTLMSAIDEGYDIAISSRKTAGSKITVPQPWYRRITSYCFAVLVKTIVPLNVSDTQNGFKLFRAVAAEKIFSHQVIFYWAFDVETLALAEVFEFKVKEVPIEWNNDDDSQMRLSGMVRMVLELLLIKLNLWINLYKKNERRSKERRARERVTPDRRISERS